MPSFSRASSRSLAISIRPGEFTKRSLRGHKEAAERSERDQSEIRARSEQSDT